MLLVPAEEHYQPFCVKIEEFALYRVGDMIIHTSDNIGVLSFSSLVDGMEATQHVQYDFIFGAN